MTTRVPSVPTRLPASQRCAHGRSLFGPCEDCHKKHAAMKLRQLKEEERMQREFEESRDE